MRRHVIFLLSGCDVLIERDTVEELQNEVELVSVLIDLVELHQILVLQASEHLQLVEYRFLALYIFYFSIFHAFQSLFFKDFYCSVFPVVLANALVNLGIVPFVEVFS